MSDSVRRCFRALLAPKAEEGNPRRATRWLISALLFVILMIVYLANGDFVQTNDATPNLYMPVSLFSEGNLTFSPDEFPFMFTWRATPQEERLQGNRQLDPQSFAALHAQGLVEVTGCKYFVVPTLYEGEYTNFFGAGAAISAMPFFAVAHLLRGDLGSEPMFLWFLGKWVASGFVAGSAVLLWLCCTHFVNRWQALLLAAAYGLGTCVWSTSSQTLRQHGPNAFFLALGTYALLRLDRGNRYAVLSALAYGWAVWCRPTSALVVVCVAFYILARDRRSFMVFVLTGLPLAIALALYNQVLLGSPLLFGQTVGGETIALSKTGTAEVWQTPLLEGLAGLLASPSRGLFVYSPFFLFAVWGVVRAWSSKEYAVLWPLSIAAFGILCIEAKHFDWWGGWSYGYRHIVDISLWLILLLIPVIGPILRHRVALGAFVLFLTWSVLVQVLGVTAYNLDGWNARTAVWVQYPNRREPLAVVDRRELTRILDEGDAKILGPARLDVDSRQHRHRLWSVTDTQIGYYLGHFAEARRIRRERFEQ